MRTKEVQIKTLAYQLAKHISKDGRIRLKVEIELFPMELIAIARKALHEGTTVDEVISDYMDRGNGAIVDFVGDYMNSLPGPKLGVVEGKSI